MHAHLTRLAGFAHSLPVDALAPAIALARMAISRWRPNASASKDPSLRDPTLRQRNAPPFSARQITTCECPGLKNLDPVGDQRCAIAETTLHNQGIGLNQFL